MISLYRMSIQKIKQVWEASLVPAASLMPFNRPPDFGFTPSSELSSTEVGGEQNGLVCMNKEMEDKQMLISNIRVAMSDYKNHSTPGFMAIAKFMEKAMQGEWNEGYKPIHGICVQFTKHDTFAFLDLLLEVARTRKGINPM